MKTIVIFHKADFDGIFCREIAKKFLPDAILIGWDYGDPADDIKNGLNAGDALYMLDISVDGLMDWPGLIWIDHHKSAIEKFTPEISGVEKYEGRFGRQIAGYRIDGVAACRLAWQWFSAGGTPTMYWCKEDYVERRVSEPLAVRLAGEYDIWDKRDPDAELFQHGLRSRELTSHDWNILLSSGSRPTVDEIESMIDVGHPIDLRPDGTADTSVGFVRGLLEAGKAIQYAKGHENESIIKAAGFDLDFEGLKFLACNHARYNSFLFTAGLRPEHDACFGFAWRDGCWTVSLYHAPGKEHHDLSKIAVSYGGGGHRGACGFKTGSLPFLT